MPLLAHMHFLAVVQTFLQRDLKQAPLSPTCQAQREAASNTIENLISKIRHAHPSIRPRVNTPGTGKKPPIAPPPADPPLPTTEEGEELYEDPTPDTQAQEEAEEYLDFEPTGPVNTEDQEMYEAMTAEQDEVYDQPSECCVCVCVCVCVRACV